MSTLRKVLRSIALLQLVIAVGFCQRGIKPVNPRILRAAAVTTQPVSLTQCGAVGDGIADDTRAIQSCMASNRVVTVQPSRVCYRSGNITIANISNLTIEGTGGKICWNGTAAGAALGFQLVGLVDNLKIHDVIAYGDGVLAHGHSFIWSASGQTLSNVKIERNTISNVMMGISLNSDAAGSIRNAVIADNDISNVIGEIPGTGYGIHVSDGSGPSSDISIVNNRVYRAQRHSVYVARGGGVLVRGNRIYEHRHGLSQPASARPAIVVARSSSVIVSNNECFSCADGFVSVSGDASGGVTSVQVADNQSWNGSRFADYTIGGQDPATEGFVTDVLFVANTSSASASGAGCFDLFSGKRVSLVRNVCTRSGESVPVYGVDLWGKEESGTALYTDGLIFSGNTFTLANAAGGPSYAVRFESPAAVSTLSAYFGDNKVFSGSGFRLAATLTDPNITLVNTFIDGFDTSIAAPVSVPYVDLTNLAVHGAAIVDNGKSVQFRESSGLASGSIGMTGSDLMEIDNNKSGGYIQINGNGTRFTVGGGIASANARIGGQGITDTSTSPKPTCSAGLAGTFYVDKSAIPHQPFVCVEKSDSTFSWIQLVVVP